MTLFIYHTVMHFTHHIIYQLYITYHLHITYLTSRISISLHTPSLTDRCMVQYHVEDVMRYAVLSVPADLTSAILSAIALESLMTHVSQTLVSNMYNTWMRHLSLNLHTFTLSLLLSLSDSLSDSLSLTLSL